MRYMIIQGSSLGISFFDFQQSEWYLRDIRASLQGLSVSFFRASPREFAYCETSKDRASFCRISLVPESHLLLYKNLLFMGHCLMSRIIRVIFSLFYLFSRAWFLSYCGCMKLIIYESWSRDWFLWYRNEWLDFRCFDFDYLDAISYISCWVLQVEISVRIPTCFHPIFHVIQKFLGSWTTHEYGLWNRIERVTEGTTRSPHREDSWSLCNRVIYRSEYIRDRGGFGPSLETHFLRCQVVSTPFC